MGEKRGFTSDTKCRQKCRHFVSAEEGFTLVEVIVAVVIVALTATGILASFIAAQGYVSRSRGRISAANAYRQQMERLRPEVNQETWNNTATCLPSTNGLALTANCTGGWTAWELFPAPFGTAPWNGTRRYNVTEVSPGGPRRVELQINWTEPGS